MKPRITLALLKSKGACAEQVRLFRQHFGEGPAPLNKRTAIAMAQVFSWDWAANNLLSEKGWGAYNEVYATAWKAFVEARAPAWKAFVKARAMAGKEFDEAYAPAWKAFEEACDTAWKAFVEARAIAFITQARKEYK